MPVVPGQCGTRAQSSQALDAAQGEGSSPGFLNLPLGTLSRDDGGQETCPWVL